LKCGPKKRPARFYREATATNAAPEEERNANRHATTGWWSLTGDLPITVVCGMIAVTLRDGRVLVSV
jgi:hypothetical protein